MVGSRKLSNDEVEALLSGLSNGEESDSAVSAFDPTAVRDFDFGSDFFDQMIYFP